MICLDVERKVFRVSYIVPFRKGGVTFIEKSWTEGFLVITKSHLIFVSKDKKIDAKIPVSSVTLVGRIEQNPLQMPGSKDFILSIDYYLENYSHTALISADKNVIEEIRDALVELIGEKEEIRLNFEQKRLLMLLYQGITRVDDLANILNVTPEKVNQMISSLIELGLVDPDGTLTKRGYRILSSIMVGTAESERLAYEVAREFERKMYEMAINAIESLKRSGALPESREKISEKSFSEWIDAISNLFGSMGLVKEVQVDLKRVTNQIILSYSGALHTQLVESLYSLYGVCIDPMAQIVRAFLLEYFGCTSRVINISSKGEKLTVTIEYFLPPPL